MYFNDRAYGRLGVRVYYFGVQGPLQLIDRGVSRRDICNRAQPRQAFERNRRIRAFSLQLHGRAVFIAYFKPRNIYGKGQIKPVFRAVFLTFPVSYIREFKYGF